MYDATDTKKQSWTRSNLISKTERLMRISVKIFLQQHFSTLKTGTRQQKR